MIIDDESESSNSKVESMKKPADMMEKIITISQQQMPRKTVQQQDRLQLKRKSALIVTDDMMHISMKNNASHNLNQFAVMRRSKMISNTDK